MKKLWLFAGVLLLVFPLSAHAYIDPGTGSFVIQMVIASVLGSLFYFKNIWQKVKSFFSKQPKSMVGKNDERPDQQ